MCKSLIAAIVLASPSQLTVEYPSLNFDTDRLNSTLAAYAFIELALPL